MCFRELRAEIGSELLEVDRSGFKRDLERLVGGRVSGWRLKRGEAGIGLVILAEKLRERLDMADAIVRMLEGCGCAGSLQREKIHLLVVKDSTS